MDWKVVHGLMDTITRTKTKKLINAKKKHEFTILSVQCIITKTMLFPTLVE